MRPLVLALAAVAAAALAPAAASAGPLQDSCGVVDARLAGLCHGGEQIVSAGVAACRWAGTPGPACPRPDVDGFAGSWADRALAQQYRLAGDVPLRNAPWIGTHNSFNSTAEMGPTLSDTDANQQLSLVDQLRLDVRSLELDVHWFPNAAAGGRAPVVCHARGADEGHAGCSVEKQLEPVLREISGWLRRAENRRAVLLLYVENHLEGQAGHEAAAAAFERTLGDLLYRPTGGASCTQLPFEVTRDQVLAAGAQVIVVGNCGVGAAWNSISFGWAAHEEGGEAGTFTDFPQCGPDYDRATYERTLIRYYEDSTGLSAAVDAAGGEGPDGGITPERAAWMARCGVDLLGLDQLLPGDGRLEALVWSWAPGEPGAGGRPCALARGADGRWVTASCGRPRRVACRNADGAWTVPAAVVPRSRAAAVCSGIGATFSVPRTGYESSLLRVAAGGADVALAYRRSGGAWAAQDAR